MRQYPTGSSGSVLVTSLIMITFLTTMLFGLMILADVNLARASQRIFLLQTQYAAETGADIALAKINQSGANEVCSNVPSGSPVSTTDKLIMASGTRYKATYDIAVVCGTDANEKRITSVGKVYQPANAATPKYTRTIEVLVKRTGTVTTSNVLSRNIVEIGSAVKQVIAKDIHINSYIKMNKNVTELIAENIVVADKKTGANNCSIEGPGDIVKPSTFENAGQTRTVIKAAYNITTNNCVGLKPSSSSTDFEILENQTDIQKVQSTYIPWSYKMDASYTDAGSCSLWTTNASTVNIPAVGSKATHYPNSQSGVDNSCASSSNNGSINLRNDTTYNINDHVHIRANLCRTASCRPIFNNPTSEAKFIFVEGTIDFLQLRTAPGSGPLVFVSYGSDPASLSSVCPLGGAVRISQSGNDATLAPSAFLLAINGGLCLDGTKFGAQKSLGGVSGKNLYIATHSGTPFHLRFDPDFPVNEVPINLSFKAARYIRK